MSLFSSTVIDKAHRLLTHGSVKFVEAGVYHVYGESRDVPYLVTTDADPGTRKAKKGTCSCKWANNSPPHRPPWVSTCSHVAAVLLAVRDGLMIPRDVCGALGEPYEMGGVETTPLCNREINHPGPHRDGISELLWGDE